MTIELYNDDCMIGMKNYEDNHFDLAIVDPPYGIGVPKQLHSSGSWSNKQEVTLTTYKRGDWDDERPDKSYFEELFRVSKRQIIWGGNYFTDYLYPSKHWIIWDKKRHPKMSFAQAELAWCSFGRNVRFFRRSWILDKNNVSNNPTKAAHYTRIHPTQKPPALYHWILRNYAEKGYKILDTHLGSGSVAMACYDHGFDLVGYEIDKDYFDAAMNRLQNHKKQLSLFGAF